MATNLLNFKHWSPRVLLTPLRLPSVSTLHLPGVSCKKLLTSSKVILSSLHFGSPNSKSPSISNSVRTAKSFHLSNRINRRFSKISTCNDRRYLTCQHISCESTITSFINGKRQTEIVIVVYMLLREKLGVAVLSTSAKHLKLWKVTSAVIRLKSEIQQCNSNRKYKQFLIWPLHCRLGQDQCLQYVALWWKK